MRVLAPAPVGAAALGMVARGRGEGEATAELEGQRVAGGGIGLKYNPHSCKRTASISLLQLDARACHGLYNQTQRLLALLPGSKSCLLTASHGECTSCQIPPARRMGSIPHSMSQHSSMIACQRTRVGLQRSRE